MMKQLKAVDFFCGGGGMSYGLQEAGIRILAGIDYEINCKETYETNIKGASFIHANVFELTEKELEKTLDISRKDDNLILVGCSPCQYWSVIRTSKEKSEKSKSLLSEFQRFVEYFVPGYVVVENVPGFSLVKKKAVWIFLYEDWKNWGIRFISEYTTQRTTVFRKVVNVSL
ncbi:DNA cytosine methyltransferase [Actinobacillus suis]|nr:DNA cytosine methyltransferase [Actinobacillus suis]UTH25885.1 DNA cytosine methyltransferase [Actinobacillus suis]